MYDNEFYSGSDAGEHTSGVFSGAQSDVNQSQNNTGYSTYQTSQTESFTGSSANQNNGYDGAEKDKGEKHHRARKSQGGGFLRKAMLSISLGLFFGLFAGIGFYAVQQGMGHAEQTSGEAHVQENTENLLASDQDDSGIKLTNTNNITVIESDVSDVVEEVMPAMVSIVNNYTETGSFFGQTYTQEQAASGSGIIVSESDTELLVVTNYHVIEGATTLEVTFIDGNTAEAKVKGTDSDMDLAVIAVSLDDISVETKNAIAVATLGDSDNLKLGEPVIAIGNALGYGQSVTNGIISALDREITMSDGSTGTFIQTNAAINFGNSGGALLNMNGEVIGINSNKIGGDSIEGMGYAIPISSASPIIADLMEHQTRNKVEDGESGYLGVTIQEVTSQISQMYNMPTGIYIVSVEEGSAAQTAGIMTGDIITKFDGEKISSYSDLQNILQYFAAGDTAKVTVMRPEKGEYVEYQYDITLGERPSSAQ